MTDTSKSHFITEWSQGRSLNKSLKEKIHEEQLPTGLFRLLLSLLPYKAQELWIVLPQVDWAFLHQLVIKTIPQTCPQANLRWAIPYSRLSS